MARRNPLVESLQQLRHPISRAMEYDGALSRVVALHRLSYAVVDERLSACAHVSRRRWHVQIGAPIIRKPLRRDVCRIGLRVERTEPAMHHVALQSGRARLDAMGRLALRTRMETR